MGVHEFTGTNSVVSVEKEAGRRKRIILVVALELLGPVLAIGFRLVLPWAVVKSIGLWGHIVVQIVSPGAIVLLNKIGAASGGLLPGCQITSNLGWPWPDRFSQYSVTIRRARGQFNEIWEVLQVPRGQAFNTW